MAKKKTVLVSLLVALPGLFLSLVLWANWWLKTHPQEEEFVKPPLDKTKLKKKDKKALSLLEQRRKMGLDKNSILSEIDPNRPFGYFDYQEDKTSKSSNINAKPRETATHQKLREKKIKNSVATKKSVHQTTKDDDELVLEDPFSRKKDNNGYFEVSFEKRQRITTGKAIELVLQEYLPALNLKKGTTLIGIPSFQDTRIFITITGYCTGDKRVFVDKERFVIFGDDGSEGMFHDTLAQMKVDAAKEGILDELLDTDFTGNRLARKAADIASNKNINVYVEKGQKAFIFEKKAR